MSSSASRNTYTEKARELLQSLVPKHGSEQLSVTLKNLSEGPGGLARRKHVPPYKDAMFAATSIPKRALIMEITGKVSTEREFPVARAEGHFLIHALSGDLKVPKNLVVLDTNDRGGADDDDADCKYIRRSCVPNCTTLVCLGTDGDLGVFVTASRDIDEGEELTLDFDIDWISRRRPLECAFHYVTLEVCPLERDRSVEHEKSGRKTRKEEREMWAQIAGLNLFEEAPPRLTIRFPNPPRDLPPPPPVRGVAPVPPPAFVPPFAAAPAAADVANVPNAATGPYEAPGPAPPAASETSADRTANWLKDVLASVQSRHGLFDSTPRKSCTPNCVLSTESADGVTRVYAKKAIAPNEELTIPFPACFVEQERELECVAHPNNIGSCPLERQRRARAAERLNQGRGTAEEERLEAERQQLREDRRLFEEERRRFKEEMIRSLADILRGDENHSDGADDEERPQEVD